MLTYGGILSGVIVCHRCDNKKCVRPDHLFLGSQSDNIRDCVAKGRHVKTNVIVTAEDVKEIRRLSSEGRLTQDDIGIIYGLKQAAVSAIVTRRNWKDVH